MTLDDLLKDRLASVLVDEQEIQLRARLVFLPRLPLCDTCRRNLLVERILDLCFGPPWKMDASAIDHGWTPDFVREMARGFLVGVVEKIIRADNRLARRRRH